MSAFNVHIVRFHHYQPRAIHHLAYDDLSEKLAVSRENGTIEIWSIKDSWYQEKIIPGIRSRPMESLLWINGRLFAAGVEGSLVEYDLLNCCVVKNLSSPDDPVVPVNPSIWCMCTNADKSVIAAGTNKGRIVFYDVLDKGVAYKNKTSSQEGMLLSIAWDHSRNMLVTGGTDAIFIWNAATRKMTSRISVSRKQAAAPTYVWAVAITHDFTIVSGDSRGKLTFWNGKQGVMLSSFKSHSEHVLTLALSEDGNRVYCSGVTSDIVEYRRFKSEWVSGPFRQSLHSHDVKTIVVAKNCIVSGGGDCTLMVSHVEKEPGKKHRRTALIPHKPLACVARDSRMLLLHHEDKPEGQFERSLELWRLGTTDDTELANGAYAKETSSAARLLKIGQAEGRGVMSFDISGSAEWIAYTTTSTLKLCHVEKVVNNGEASPVACNASYIQATICKELRSSLVRFVPKQNKLVCVKPTGAVVVLELTKKKEVNAIQNLRPPAFSTSGCHLLSISDSGRYLATADHNSCIHVYDLQEGKFVCSPPVYERQPTALAIHPSRPVMMVAYADQKLMEYDISAQEYTVWSRQLNGNWNKHWLRRVAHINGIYYQPGKTHIIHVYDEEMLCLIDQTERLPLTNEDLFQRTQKKKKSGVSPHAFHFCSKYKFLLHASALDAETLVILERTPLSIQEALPEAYKKKIFGT